MNLKFVFPLLFLLFFEPELVSAFAKRISFACNNLYGTTEYFATTKRTRSFYSSSTTPPTIITDHHHVVEHEEIGETNLPTSSSSSSSSRRGVVLNTIGSMIVVAAAFSGPIGVVLTPEPAIAKPNPDTAYANLRAAREELVVAGRTYFPKRDLIGLREYLDSDQATNINNYESNAQVLLESKRLDVESKKEIGTIRRYGVGADVLIMYGGLKAELSEDNEIINYSDVEKYYIRTLDSLEEVITICRNNGFE